MKRREFMGGLGIATFAFPLTARAQQRQMPTIGYLGGVQEANARNTMAFLQGLGERGYVDGSNLTVEFRWAV